MPRNTADRRLAVITANKTWRQILSSGPEKKGSQKKIRFSFGVWQRVPLKVIKRSVAYKALVIIERRGRIHGLFITEGGFRKRVMVPVLNKEQLLAKFNRYLLNDTSPASNTQ